MRVTMQLQSQVQSESEGKDSDGPFHQEFFETDILPFFPKSSSRKHLSAPKVGEGGMNGHVL